MKFLITGAYGFVGTNLCRYLTGKGHVCDAVDLPTAKRDDVPYARFHTWDDITDSSSPLLDSYDAVVHLAGKAHDLKKVASEQSYFEVNVGLTQRIFKAVCERVKGGGGSGKMSFIYFSSSKASADGNAYGRSKFEAEEYLRKNCPTSESTASLRLSILRPAMIHGPGNRGNLNLLWGIAKRGFPWPLAAFENRRSFTSVGNVCAVVEALALQGADDSAVRRSVPDIRTFPVADDEMLSTNRLIELMAEASGRKPRLWRLPRGLMKFAAKVGDLLHLPLTTERLGKLTENSFVDNAALKSALGWTRMPIAAEDGLRATLKSFTAPIPNP